MTDLNLVMASGEQGLGLRAVGAKELMGLHPMYYSKNQTTYK